jgi:tRNA modification GTPase
MESVVDKDELQKKLPCTILSISAKNDIGIDELENAVKKMFFEGNISFDEDIYITNARHKQLLTEARVALLLVREGIASQVSEDFLTIDLMTAYEKLGLIIGEEVEDDLADQIFKKFCMGK